MNFSSFFLNLVKLQLSVSKERMLIRSTEWKFILNGVFKPEVIVF